MNGAIGAFKKYLNKAKKSAKSWDKQDEVQEFSEMESQANEIIQRTQMEQWAINVFPPTLSHIPIVPIICFHSFGFFLFGPSTKIGPPLSGWVTVI